MTQVVNNVLDLIGNTPLIKVKSLDTGVCELYLKLESQNPGGSIKDRIALSMVEAAERDGKIKPGDTLVEATVGNTGLGLALIASQKGYNLKLVVLDKMSQEKIFHLKAMGVEIIPTRSDVGRGHPDYYQDRAEHIAETTPNCFYINQFENPANPLAHETTTGPEIWEQMNQDIDAVVCGVGSGGTLTGLGRFFNRVDPHVEMVLADPKGSVLAPYVEHGVMLPHGSWQVEGIGEDFIPDNCDLSFVRKAYTITDQESFATARDVLQQEGILCGSSSGTLIAAALRYCREQTTPKRVVTFVCDSGNKYLSKMFNPYWLDDQGFVPHTLTHDLQDMIARPFLQGAVIVAKPEETLLDVYTKMKSHDISQIPVMARNEIIGLIDETDVLLAVVGNPAGFNMPVREAIKKTIATIQYDQSLPELTAILEQGLAACVMKDGQFIGLITPIDFLNYLRKRTARG